MLKIQELIAQRTHITTSIQMVDNKAIGVVNAYKDQIPTGDKGKLFTIYNSILFPVVIASDGDYEEFSLTEMTQDGLLAECETLKSILLEKYKNMSKLMTMIRNQTIVTPAKQNDYEGLVNRKPAKR